MYYGWLKKETVPSYYTFPATVWKINMCSRQTASFKALRISLKYHFVASCPCATPNIYSLLNPNEADTPCKLLTSVLSTVSESCTVQRLCSSNTQLFTQKSKGHKNLINALNVIRTVINRKSTLLYTLRDMPYFSVLLRKWVIPPGNIG